jgi:TonB family protein
MVKLTLFILLLFSLPAFSQKDNKDTLVRYFNADMEPCKKKDFVYIGVIIRDPLGWNALIYKDTATIILRGKYRDESCTIKEGWFMYYYANGKRAVAGKYENNIRQNNWTSWYSSGQLKDSVFFLNDLQEGPSYSFFENGKLESTGSFKQGSYDHEWIFYHENGTIATKEKYALGKLSDLECFDTSGLSLGINCAIKRSPEIKGKYGGVVKYFKDSLVYPAVALNNNLEGYVTVEFTITKTGKLTGIIIVASPYQVLSDEVLRVLNSVPAWYPAIDHNRVMDFTISLNIPFFVNNKEFIIDEKDGTNKDLSN